VLISSYLSCGNDREYLEYVALVSVAFGIPPIAAKSFRTLRRYQFDTNCLMFFASVGALALQDFIEAAAVVFLFALSEWLEVRATTRARQALSAIVHLRPEKAYLIHPTTQELLLVPASSVPVGALVSVKTGDKIPCDGVVVEGLSTVDESSLTGESRPIRKAPGGTVSGGAVNSGLCPLTVRTTSTAENSAVSRLIRLVEEAQANRSDTEKIVDEFAKVYTPVVVLAAIFMCTIPWAFGKDIGREWTHNGLILIVVACPCALIISTPVSYVAGLAATAQKGVLIKGGASLEALGSVKSICFDKTGTLTNGEFSLLHLTVLSDKLSRKRVLQYLSLMEERASHPVAQAILTAAHNESVVIPKTMVLQKHTILNGEGVAGVVDGLEVHVGNERLFERLGLLDGVPVTDRQSIESWKLLGGTVGYMSIEGFGIVCAYCAADGIRDESAGVVSNLKRLGISTIMLTGDNEDAARAVGLLAGLSGDEIKAKLLPEEKLHYVEDLSQGHSKRSVICNPCSKRELVLMCGDGVNDAPALAAADIGVAMGAGAALSMETSDVTLLDSNLEKLEYSIRMGRRVTVKIIQNVVFSISVKLVVLGFALAGMTKLWAAIASDVGAMLLVTLNAMLLLPRKQTQKDLIGLKGDLEEGNLSPTMARRRSELTDVADVSPAGSDCGTEAGHAGEKTCASGCCGSGSEELGGIGKKECFKGCCDYSDRQDGGSDVPCYKACESVCCKSQEEVASSQGCCSSGWCDIPKKGPPAVEGCCSTRHCDGKTKETPVKDCCSSGCSDSGEEEEDACCSSGCCEEEAEKGCASGCCGSSHSDESCGGEKKEKAGTFTHGCCESKEGEYTEGHEDTVSR
jgi:Cd2+/Zn2+-exporting ATPase